MSSIGDAVSSQPANSSSAAPNVASAPTTSTVAQAQVTTKMVNQEPIDVSHHFTTRPYNK